MTESDILRKISGLLAKAQGTDNENEAAAFAAKAQDLMIRHQVSEAQVDGYVGDGDSTTIGEDEVLTVDKMSRWESSLFSTVAKTSGCSAYVRKVYAGQKSNGVNRYKQVYTLVGRQDDVMVAKYIYEYLVGELKRLAEAYSRTVRTNGVRGRLKKARESYLLGATVAVQNNLLAQARERAAADNKTGALVLVKEDAVNAYMGDMDLKKKYHQKRTVDYGAYVQGQRDGQRVTVNRATGAGERPAPQARIGG